MKDFYPKGTGNSRYLKSSIPSSITHEELVSMLREGTFPIDLNGINPDGVAQQGTPLNKATLLTDATAALFGLPATAVPDQALSILSSAALYKTVSPKQQIGNLPVGTTIYLNENGSPVPYLIVNQGIPQNSNLYDSSCDGTWVLRQDIYSTAAWDAGNSNVLPGADIFTTMANMLSLYDADVQSSIKTVKIPYCVGGGSSTVNSGANGLQCQIFPLSNYEVGWTQSDSQYFPVDGAKLSYFTSGMSSDANNKRIANYNGSATSWWLRSPYISNPILAWSVFSNGAYNSYGCPTSHGIRPAFILPSTFIYTYPPIPGLYDTQDNLIMSIPSVVTGSYVGTGTGGKNNPIKLTFSFTPKIVFVAASGTSGYAIFISPIGRASMIDDSGVRQIDGISWTENSVSWYAQDQEYQLNLSGTIYYYYAIL